MDNFDPNELANIVLAPYILKATALRGKARKVGGNQFRHVMATFTILLDYHYTDSVMLKAAFIHDLFEDCGDTNREEIAALDDDGPAVVKLVEEVTRSPGEKKEVYLARIRDRGSMQAKTLKVADRISNLTDLNTSVFSDDYIRYYIEQSREYILPFAQEVNADMAIEITDLIKRRLEFLQASNKGSFSR